MKRMLQYCMSVALLFSSACYADTLQTYTFDPMHTYVLWHVNHFGFSNPSGKWFANGTIQLDRENPQKSKVNVTIQIAGLDTGLPELNQHLLGPLFFDAKQFPTATFVSDQITVTGKTTANVHGILTMHGEAKPITLAVTLNKEGINPVTNKQTLGFSAITTLERSTFDISTLLPDVSDEVKIDIEAEAYKTN